MLKYLNKNFSIRGKVIDETNFWELKLENWWKKFCISVISDEMSVPSLHFLREKAKKLQAKLSHKGMFICKLLLHTIYLFQFWILQETYNKRNPHLNDLDLQFSFRLRLGRSTRKGAFEVSSLVDYIIVFCIHSLNSSQLDPVFPVPQIYIP